MEIRVRKICKTKNCDKLDNETLFILLTTMYSTLRRIVIPNRYQDYDLEKELFFVCSMKKITA